MKFINRINYYNNLLTKQISYKKVFKIHVWNTNNQTQKIPNRSLNKQKTPKKIYNK